MIGTPRSAPPTEKKAIRSHYDLATPFYRLVWGPHIHHGLWSAEDVARDVPEMQPRLAQEQLTDTLAALAADEYAEKEGGESPDCDDPDCAERENEAEARSIARQVWAKDGEVEIDDDAGVSMAFTDPDGDPTGAYVQAWVFVEFTANSAKGAK